MANGNNGCSCTDWKFDVSNAIEATDSHFNVSIHENWGQQEVDDLVAALAKIESAYSKESSKAEAHPSRYQAN